MAERSIGDRTRAPWRALLGLVTLVLSSAIAWGTFPSWAQGGRPDVLSATSTPLKRDEAMRILRGAEVSILRDPGGQLSFEQVSAVEMASRFRPLDQGLSLGYLTDALWIRIDLQREVDAVQKWRLELTATLFNDVRYFSYWPDGEVRVQQAGDQFPFAERPVAYRRPAFDLDLPTSKPQSYFLRIETDSTILGQFVIWQPAAFDAALQRDTLWIGGVLGIVLISILFFLQAWFLNRDRLLLAAAGVTLTFAFGASANLGLLSQYLFYRHPFWAESLHPVLMALFFTVLVALFGRALDLGSLYPRLYRLRVMAGLLCAAAAASRLLDWYGAVGGRLMMAGMLCGLGWISVAAWLAWHQRRRGLLTAVSLTVFTGSFSIAPLIALGVLPSSRYFELFWVVGSVGFILMAQLTTIDEVRNARIQRRIAEREASDARELANREAAWRREQTLYFAGVAHDLRTPLNAIAVGLANLGRGSGAVAHAMSDRLTGLQASARRMGDMIERHLQMLRLQQPGFELMIVPTPISDCLDQVSTAVVDACPGTQFQMSIQPGVPDQVPMDLELIVRALTNLLANAARVAPTGTAVELEVLKGRGGDVGFVVRDRGPGMPAECVEAFREMRWQRSENRSTLGAGDPRFGIGLPMAFRIAELHRGQLVYARSSDGITAFTLWLPGA